MNIVVSLFNGDPLQIIMPLLALIPLAYLIAYGQRASEELANTYRNVCVVPFRSSITTFTVRGLWRQYLCGKISPDEFDTRLRLMTQWKCR